MDSVKLVQSAIDYMEAHLYEPLDFAMVAKQHYVSAYHFHRIFSLMTGISPSEYVRNRRLSMAAQALTKTDARVTDIALEHGYESPESFTKAFTRFHGMTPSEVRQKGGPLKLYHRLIIKLIVEGGMLMQYRIVEQPGFNLVVKKKQFSSEQTLQPENQDIALFWDALIADGTLERLKGLADNHDFYGVCSPISQESQLFDYAIGCPCSLSDVPAEFELCSVGPQLWAVFDCIGHDGVCIGETWDKIFKEFLVVSNYQMLDSLDFEKYPEHPIEGVFCEIWIPVKLK